MNDPSLRYHLGTCSVSRSALARGNKKLNACFFQELFRLLYTRLQSSGSVPGKRFRFKGKLFSLDGSLIDLSMTVFPWADVAPKKAAFKLHLGLDHAGLVPAFAEVAPNNRGCRSALTPCHWLDAMVEFLEHELADHAAEKGRSLEGSG